MERYIYILERYIYTLPRRVTINTNLRVFQYKLVHNILYLIEMLYKFGQKVSSLCSFYLKEPENPIHFILEQKKLSLGAATFFPKFINNSSNYTTELHLWIY